MEGISCTHFYIKKSLYSNSIKKPKPVLGTVDLWHDVIIPLASSIAEQATKVSPHLTANLDYKFSDQLLGSQLDS